ncbi:putative subunit of the Multisubunit Na+/H+ antiporter [Geoglobus ahangari]|uniref:Putative subunit of the Multisubunit Na+/H+ antiporter n=1 Tax=Geoglobus ahangari TaxID=113653 RepID=A0A0F7DBP1_9EURY|nr:hydrogen gas-evolving membrane-bound hydrogenase subunit E [Geoglobus ahangari]AKG91431.1 putative subunit of the Multisubunit Na+/H+ antiporter [Geoglobus ahangari]
MIVPLDIALIIFLIVSAVSALIVRDLLASIAILGTYTFVMACIYVQMNSVDVGFTEAAIGAGASTALMVASLTRLRRFDTSRINASKAVVGAMAVFMLAGLFIYVVEDMPPFGDPESPPNKWIELFSLEDRGLSAKLESGVLPKEIKSRIESLGYTTSNNWPPLEDGTYRVVWNEEEHGWEVLIEKNEKFFPNLEKLYFIEPSNGELKVYRYSIPVRWEEKCEEEMNTPNMVTAGLADYRGYDTLGETVVIFTAAVSVAALLRRGYLE